MEWSQVYNGHSDMVLPSGVVATLLHTKGSKPSIKLVQLSAAPGSPKMDIAMSLDLLATREQYEFVEHMKEESLVLLQRLEDWVDKQGSGTHSPQGWELAPWQSCELAELQVLAGACCCYQVMLRLAV